MKITINEEYINNNYDEDAKYFYADAYLMPILSNADLCDVDELNAMNYLGKYIFHAFEDKNGIEIIVPEYQLDIEGNE